MKFVLIVLMLFTSFSQAQLKESAVDFKCEADYIAEAHYWNDLNRDGEMAITARTVLAKKDSRMSNGTLIGLIGGTATAASLLRNKGDLGWTGGILIGTGAGGVPGALVGSVVGAKSASKKTKDAEKQAMSYLKSLEANYNGIVNAYNLITSAIIVADEKGHLPDEVAKNVNDVAVFLKVYGINLTVGDAVKKIVEADSDETLCKDHNALNTDEIAEVLKKN